MLPLIGRCLTPAAAVIACLVVAAPGYAEPASRNFDLESQFNDYAPAPGNLYGAGYSSCWGYIHGDGREYAIIGTTNGTAIYNVTNPISAYRVGFIAGPPSLWREMKSYRNWIYVVTENWTASPAAGVQIIRMTNPEAPILVGTYSGTFSRSHTISVDTTRALLFCNGTRSYDPGTGNSTQMGMRILSIANPEAPVEIGWWPGGTVPIGTSDYVHDCVPVGNRLYASSVYAGTERILDITNPAAPTQISAWTYPGAYYTHNSWPDQSGNYLYVTDEQNGQTLRVFDIRVPTAPVLVNEFTPNPQAIVHNAHVKGNELFLANYTEGIRALDITDPAHPAEYGYADTYPGPSGGYAGVWGIYPYFPSGTVIASDMQTGLYVYRPVHNYGLVRVKVNGSGALASGQACGANGSCCCAPATCTCPNHVHTSAAGASGVSVYVVDEGDSSKTAVDGVVSFAPSPGTHTVIARKFGFFDAVATVSVESGVTDSVTFTLVPKPMTTFSGTVLNHVTGLPLEGAEINLRYTPVHVHTNAAGVFDMGLVPSDVYRVEVRRPGSVPESFDRHVGPAPELQTFRLIPTPVWDPMAVTGGWTVGGVGTSDNAIAGMWTRVEPLGTSTGTLPPAPAQGPASAGPWRGSDVLAAWTMGSEGFGSGRGDPLEAMVRPRPGPLHGGHEGEGANPGQVQPELDRSPAPDSTCWVTGQGTNPLAIDEADVDGPNGTDPGKTTLTSPAYNATGMSTPTIGVWTWFYSEFASPDDWLAILISNNNGTSWVPVDTLRGEHNHWEEHTIRVADFATPTSQVRLRFVAADYGVASIVEAGVDDLTLYDGATPLVDLAPTPTPARLALRAPYPNPTRDNVRIALDLPRAGSVSVDVLDLSGRRVRTLHSGTAQAGTLQLSWDGVDAGGHVAPAGLYFVRASGVGETAEARVVRVK